MMFFKENFVHEMIPLIAKFRYSKLGRTKEKPAVTNPFESMNFAEEIADSIANHKLNILRFVEFGQSRGKDWYQMDYKEYEEIAPKVTHKKKFLKPRKIR
jgi:hypothetical protein